MPSDNTKFNTNQSTTSPQSSTFKGLASITRSKSIQTELNLKASNPINFFKLRRHNKKESVDKGKSKAAEYPHDLGRLNVIYQTVSSPTLASSQPRNLKTLSTDNILLKRSSYNKPLPPLNTELTQPDWLSTELNLRLQSLDLHMSQTQNYCEKEEMVSSPITIPCISMSLESDNKPIIDTISLSKGKFDTIKNERTVSQTKLSTSTPEIVPTKPSLVGQKSPHRKSLHADLMQYGLDPLLGDAPHPPGPQVQPAPAPSMYWRKIPGRGDRPIKPLRAHTATLVGDQLYLFGGCNARSCFNDVYIFDTDTMYWSKPHIQGIPPTPRRAHSATLVDHTKIFVFGGGNGTQYYNDLHILDTVTLRWSTPVTYGDVPSPRRAHTSCYYKNSIYVFGGGDGLYPLNDIYQLDLCDPKGYVWHKLEGSGKLPPPRGYHTTTLVDNRLIVYGGSDGSDCFDDLFMFDLDKLTWVELLVKNKLPRLAHTATLIGPFFYVVGGRNNRNYSGELMVLNLQKGSWESKKTYGSPPSPRGYHTAILHDARLFVFGGYDGSKFFQDMHVLDLAASAYLTQMKNIKILT